MGCRAVRLRGNLRKGKGEISDEPTGPLRYTRRLADHIEARVVLPETSPEHKALIERRGERYMFYQFYLLDQDEHIKAAETFCATDDGRAQETADLVHDACNDEYERYELWRCGERIARSWAGGNAASPSLSDLVTARQENILDLEDRLQRTFACVRKSRKLLEISSALRDQINGV